MPIHIIAKAALSTVHKIVTETPKAAHYLSIALTHAINSYAALAAAKAAQRAAVSHAARTVHAAVISSGKKFAFEMGPIGIPIFTGVVSNVVSSKIQDLTKDEKIPPKNARQARRRYLSAARKAAKASLEYRRFLKVKDLECYLQASAEVESALKFIKSKNT
jgi:hypothetical protein